MGRNKIRRNWTEWPLAKKTKPNKKQGITGRWNKLWLNKGWHWSQCFDRCPDLSEDKFTCGSIGSREISYSTIFDQTKLRINQLISQCEALWEVSIWGEGACEIFMKISPAFRLNYQTKVPQFPSLSEVKDAKGHEISNKVIRNWHKQIYARQLRSQNQG